MQTNPGQLAFFPEISTRMNAENNANQPQNIPQGGNLTLLPPRIYQPEITPLHEQVNLQYQLRYQSLLADASGDSQNFFYQSNLAVPPYQQHSYPDSMQRNNTPILIASPQQAIAPYFASSTPRMQHAMPVPPPPEIPHLTAPRQNEAEHAALETGKRKRSPEPNAKSSKSKKNEEYPTDLLTVEEARKKFKTNLEWLRSSHGAIKIGPGSWNLPDEVLDLITSRLLGEDIVNWSESCRAHYGSVERTFIFRRVFGLINDLCNLDQIKNKYKIHPQKLLHDLFRGGLTGGQLAKDGLSYDSVLMTPLNMETKAVMYFVLLARHSYVIQKDQDKERKICQIYLKSIREDHFFSAFNHVFQLYKKMPKGDAKGDRRWKNVGQYGRFFPTNAYFSCSHFVMQNSAIIKEKINDSKSPVFLSTTVDLFIAECEKQSLSHFSEIFHDQLLNLFQCIESITEKWPELETQNRIKRKIASLGSIIEKCPGGNYPPVSCYESLRTKLSLLLN